MAKRENKQSQELDWLKTTEDANKFTFSDIEAKFGCDPKKNMGVILRWLRLKTEETQGDIANELKMTPNSIAMVEAGKRVLGINPFIEIIRKRAKQDRSAIEAAFVRLIAEYKGIPVDKLSVETPPTNMANDGSNSDLDQLIVKIKTILIGRPDAIKIIDAWLDGKFNL